MMRKFLMTTVGVLAIGGSAIAADLPSPRLAPPPPIVPIFTWTGFYIGANAGYAFRTDDDDDDDFFNDGFDDDVFDDNGFFDDDNDDDGGFTGGGQIGYLYQMGTIVVGVEADIQYIDLGGDDDDDFFDDRFLDDDFFGRRNNRSSIEWFGTARGILGVSFDRALIYATGGFAYGDGDDNDNSFFNDGIDDNGRFFNDNGDDDLRTGYAVGGGIRYAFTNNIIGRIEGLYVNLDEDDNNNGFFNDGIDDNGRFFDDRGRDNEFFVVRGGIDVKFW